MIRSRVKNLNFKINLFILYKSSNRVDDNAETIKMRIRTFFKETKPVLEFYKDLGVLYEIEPNIAVSSPEVITVAIAEILNKTLD